MARADLKILTPPNYLTGAVVLFWGGVTGNILPAVLVAMVLEGRRWVPVDWEFDEEGQVQSFYLSVLLMVATAVLSWVLDEEASASFTVISWLPVLFLPVEFVQRYGRREFVTLNTFFFLTKRRLELDRKEGREVDPIEINTGYPYIFLTLLAACCVAKEVTYLWSGFCILFLLLLWAVGRARGLRAGGLLVVMPLICALSWGGQLALDSAHKWVERNWKSRFMPTSGSTRTISFMTQLGELGDVQLSPQVEWRVWSDTNPEYLRLASYNNYNQRRWSYSYPQEGFESWQESFEKHERYVVQSDLGEMTYFRAEDAADVQQLEKEEGILVRGTIEHTNPTAVVPTSKAFMAISEMPGDVTYAEVNSMATLRLVDRAAVVNYRLYPDPDRQELDVSPVEEIDLKIPEAEQAVIRQLVKQLGLRQLASDEERVQKIMSYFGTQFTYSTDFDPGEYDYESTHLTWFLTEVQCGHCEYFATATTLLLRACGIPARYATGYSVNEKKGDLWLVRGTNAHAWTRAYIDGNWVNVDATPANLRGVVEQEVTIIDWFKDRVAMLREDFFVWRQSEENKTVLMQRGAIVVLLLVGWIVFRLWQHRSREQLGADGQTTWQGEPVVTPLHALQKELTKAVGPRQTGETMGMWLQRAAEEGAVQEDTVEQALQLHQQMRYDPEGGAAGAQLEELAKAIKAQLKQHARKA